MTRYHKKGQFSPSTDGWPTLKMSHAYVASTSPSFFRSDFLWKIKRCFFFEKKRDIDLPIIFYFLLKVWHEKLKLTWRMPRTHTTSSIFGPHRRLLGGVKERAKLNCPIFIYDFRGDIAYSKTFEHPTKYMKSSTYFLIHSSIYMETDLRMLRKLNKLNYWSVTHDILNMLVCINLLDKLFFLGGGILNIQIL